MDTTRAVLVVAAMLALAPMSAQRGDLSIQGNSGPIAIGQSVQLSAVLNGSQVVSAKWSISDPLVATLTQSGLVTGRSAGMAVVRAQVKNQKAETTITVTDPNPPPPPPPPPDPDPAGRGPQSSITCPAGSTDVFPGQSLQAALTASVSVCLRAGVHAVTSSSRPQANTVITGEYGAILDGSGWSTSDEAAAAIRCIGNDGGTNVTIRNVTIRNMPKKGIYAADSCTGWTVDHSEVFNTQYGVVLGSGPRITNSKLHHSGLGVGGGNYALQLWNRVPGSTGLVENNEIAWGGHQQKIQNGGKVDWRNNWVHHNETFGIWNDGEGQGSIIENNLVEDNGASGIHWELSAEGIIRNNTIRRSGDHAVYISTSRDTQVYGNTMEDNFRGPSYYLTCASLAQGWPWHPDLANNIVRDNTIRVQPGAIAALFSYSGDCTAEQIAPYLSNAKGNRFENNRYTVPDVAGWWWLWNGFKTFTQWQGIGQDTTGSVQ